MVWLTPSNPNYDPDEYESPFSMYYEDDKVLQDENEITVADKLYNDFQFQGARDLPYENEITECYWTLLTLNIDYADLPLDPADVPLGIGDAVHDYDALRNMIDLPDYPPLLIVTEFNGNNVKLCPP